MASEARMRLANADAIELTITLTLTVAGWKRVVAGGNWNPFHDAVREAIAKVEEIETDTELHP